MGMYDNLKIETGRLPLSESEKKGLGEFHDWQTKDFDCILSVAEITNDGKLRFQHFDYDWDENEESGLFQLTGRKGALITKNEEWVDIVDMESVNFYGSHNDEWFEFMATFEGGQLREIRRIE